MPAAGTVTGVIRGRAVTRMRATRGAVKIIVVFLDGQALCLSLHFVVGVTLCRRFLHF